MVITKAQAKTLKYLGHSQSESTYTTIQTEKGPVKHREFPWLEVSYNEVKGEKGIREITDIIVCGKPYDGTIDEFIDLLKCGNPKIYEPYENLVPVDENPQDVAESEKGKSLDALAATVCELTHPEMEVVKSEIKDLSKDGVLTVDVQAVASNSVDSVGVHIDVNKQMLEHESVSDPFGELTGMVNPTWSSGGENLESLNAIHVEATVDKIHKDFETVIQGAKETGIPVITAEQKPAVHLDAAPEGTNDVAIVIDDSQPTPNKLTRPQLLDLRMKCAVARLAGTYYEDPSKTTLIDLMSRYPDASMKLNDVFSKDGLKPYTITEDAIKEAYPYEFTICR